MVVKQDEGGCKVYYCDCCNKEFIDLVDILVHEGPDDSLFVEQDREYRRMT